MNTIILSENAIRVVNNALDSILSKAENQNINWSDRDIETVKVAIDIIGLQTGFFWISAEKEKESNLDSRIENLDSKTYNLDSSTD